MSELNGAVLVASDQAPSEAFELLGEQHGCTMYLGKGKILQMTPELTQAVEGASVLLVGPASSLERDIAVMHSVTVAQKQGIPWIFYGDAPGSSMRPWWRELLSSAKAIAVINETEKMKTSPLFQSVEVDATGNPAWDKFWFPKMLRADARSKLGLGNGHQAIYLSGHKWPMATCPALSAAHQAVVMAGWYDRRVLIRCHGSDPCPIGVYRDAVKYSTKGEDGKPIIQLVEDDELDEAACVQAADIVIGEASTAEVGGCIRRIPTFSYLTQLTLERNRDVFGVAEWAWHQAGATIGVDDAYTLAARMRHVSEPGFFDAIRAKQEEIFVRPKKPGIALENLRALVAKYARSVG